MLPDHDIGSAKTPNASTLNNVSGGFWVMRDGNKIAIRDMADSHLENAIAMVKRNASEIKDRMALEADIASGMTNGEQASYSLEADARRLYMTSTAEFLKDYEEYQNLLKERRRRKRTSRSSE